MHSNIYGYKKAKTIYILEQTTLLTLYVELNAFVNGLKVDVDELTIMQALSCLALAVLGLSVCTLGISTAIHALVNNTFGG